MTDTKHCDYRHPRSKSHEPCGEPFTRPDNTPDHHWAMRSRCDKHQKYGKNKPLADKRLGHYEVKHPVIDSFLRGHST